MCADNGVVAEGVTQTGQEVTAIVAENFTRRATSVCLMAEIAGTDLFPVDIGMAVDVTSSDKAGVQGDERDERPCFLNLP